ncbi:POP1-domain-containing protein [Panus rudis PR-1116 ss-1]|nr:POP1-domain-containing protein [Panus rudis PR-1116 ss-1]
MCWRKELSPVPEVPKQLPGNLDVERFAEVWLSAEYRPRFSHITQARAFEINAMHTAMMTARDSATHRAWQQLPRHLRRRAASHDVRRVPARLREKAKAEMDAPKKKVASKYRHQKGKDKRITRTEAFLKRQKDKVWLETHVWHAKRMKMENMYGYRLAITPTEKAFRPSHRASVHGSILHDASYYGIIELKGLEEVLRQILNTCCDAQGPSPAAKRFVTGARACDTHMHKYNSYPFDLLGPATVIWQPLAPSSKSSSEEEKSGSDEQTEPTNASGKRKRKGKSKGKEKVQDNPPPSSKIVWVKVHPSIFEVVFQQLRLSASYVLEEVKKTRPNEPETIVEIADLRDKMNIFEILGPKSSQIIKGALKPVAEDKREEFKKFWNALKNVQTTGSLPRNMVIGFKVNDPRLTFPPKNAKVEYDPKNPSPSTPTASIFPTSTLAQSEIWDEAIRKSLSKPKYKKKDLDARRAKNPVPGTRLQATHDDDRIPVLLVQHSVEPLAATTSSNHKNPPSLHGWTLIIPQGWAMPFFSSLTYTGTRVSGQRERAVQFFEASRPCFPRDYPCTESYDEYASDREDEEKGRWKRKPPAKRVNYKKTLVRSPWRADWEVVLGLKSPPEDIDDEDGDEDMMAEDEDEDLVPAQRDNDDVVPPAATDDVPGASNNAENAAPEHPAVEEAQDNPKGLKPWLLQGPSVSEAIQAAETMFIRSTGLLQHLNSLRAKRQLQPLDPSVKAEDIWKTCLIMVKLTMSGRGKPEDMAILYAMEDSEIVRTLKDEQARKKGIVQPVGVTDDSNEDHEGPVPPQDAIIGYVTTGNFSLSLGEGSAIGAIPIARLFELKEQARRTGAGKTLLVKLRNRDSTTCRAAHLTVLEE